MAKQKIADIISNAEATKTTSSVNVIDDITRSANTDLVKVETVGSITRSYIDVPVKQKDEEGKEVVVYHKLRNAVAVATLNNIGMLSEVRKKSLKYIVLGMAKITDEHASSVGLKSAKALIKAIYPDYSDNTINKYRRIGLLFSRSTEDVNDFSYMSFIDEDVSISNLDVILTLFEGLKVEEMSLAERESAVSDFYTKYIITDMIHLHGSQTELKKEVKEILNPSITVEAKEVEEDTETATGTATETATEATEGATETATETATDSTAETASRAITSLTLIFKGNKVAEEALSTLMEELSKMF